MAAAAPDILIAATDIDQHLLECLADCRATLVRSFEEAQRVLRERWFRMVVIDVNFDHARTFDLLQHVRSLADMNGMPVLCVQGPVEFLGATTRPPRIEAQTRRCVLIVDSNVDAAHRLAELVEAAGHEVDLAYDARAARRRAPAAPRCRLGGRGRAWFGAAPARRAGAARCPDSLPLEAAGSGIDPRAALDFLRSP